MTSWLTRKVAVVAVMASAVGLSGCESLQSGLATPALRFLEYKVVPPTLAMSDVDMGCSFALGTTPLISSTRALYADPSMIETLNLTSAAACSETQALEEELRYMRAVRDKRPDEAMDARTSQKRLLERTAMRQLGAYQRMVSAMESKYKFKYGEACPRFRKDFDEIVYLLGSVAGLQAFSNDVSAQQAVGVPSDIPPKVEAAMSCLDNTKWWGVPQAARAVVWASIPGGSAGKDVAGSFDAAMTIGEQRGVRVAHVMAAIAAVTVDDQQQLRSVIRRFAGPKDFKQSPDYRFVDESAAAQMRFISDRMWTQNTGTRTPIGKFGKFWDDSAKPAANVDSFLN